MGAWLIKINKMVIVIIDTRSKDSPLFDIERTPNKCYTESCLNSGVWRSLVARLVWDQEVGSSNLPTPTTL
jgi:hypothetical protein